MSDGPMLDPRPRINLDDIDRMVNKNMRSKREVPPLARNADGDIIINIHHPRTVQGGKTIDLSDIRPVGDRLAVVSGNVDVARHINHRRTALIVGHKLNEGMVKAFNKLWAPLEVHCALYGNQLAGMRFHIIFITQPPRTGREREWLEQSVYTRLMPDGIVI